MKNKKSLILIFSMLLVLLVSCSKDDDNTPEDIAVSAIVITTENTNLLTGTTLQLSSTISPADATNKNVTWSSSDTAIATVDKDGLVTAISIGEVIITATSVSNTTVNKTSTLQIIGRDTNAITSFTINEIPASIDGTAITLELLIGTDITALSSVIEHTGVRIEPDTSTIQDFTNPVRYTVTAENGDIQEWTATVKFTEQTVKGSEFITTWDATEITIPTNPDYTYNYNVDWDDDGIIDESGITGNVTHTFTPPPGKHTIRISGIFPAIYFGGPSSREREKIISIDQWGTGEWLSMHGAFVNCKALEIPAIDVPDLTKVTDMAGMFQGITSANFNVSQWDVSNVTNMKWMFFQATANPDVSQWNVSKVTDMYQMFFRATINPDVSKWDVSKVTNMNSMFKGATSANPDVSQWDVSKVTNMESMFEGATSANPDVSEWNVSNVTHMSWMFREATSANPDVSKWDVSKVTTMYNMFRDATSANPDVSQWDISEVTSTDEMFRGATSANPDISQWDISKVRFMHWMFLQANLSNENYEKLLISFALQTTRQPNVSLGAGTATATSVDAIAAKKKLTDPVASGGSNWSITDGS